jgi:phosphoribosylglycinamide formyltransferase-1
VRSEGRVAVGVSGAGSNLRALAAAAERVELGGHIELVFSDRSCPALDWGVEQGIETALLPGLASRDAAEREAADAALAATLLAVEADVVVLAGYMRIVGPATLAAFAGRIVNTHPSLLPAFRGAHAVREALAFGVKVSGCTIHLAVPEVDAGPILAQEAVPVLADDTEAALHDRIKAVERRLYPEVLRGLIDEAGRR